LKLLASTIAERSRGPKFFQCSLAQTPTSFCPKSCFLVSYSPSPSCIGLPNLKLLDSTVAEINNFGRKSCFLASFSPSPSCISNLKLPASTVVEINRGSQIYLDTPLARTPANFGLKSCFSASYSSSPSCIPNLKLLASTVAEIIRGSQFFLDAPLARAPANFGRKSCFLTSYSPLLSIFGRKKVAFWSKI